MSIYVICLPNTCNSIILITESVSRIKKNEKNRVNKKSKNVGLFALSLCISY